MRSDIRSVMSALDADVQRDLERHEPGTVHLEVVARHPVALEIRAEAILEHAVDRRAADAICRDEHRVPRPGPAEGRGRARDRARALRHRLVVGCRHRALLHGEGRGGVAADLLRSLGVGATPGRQRVGDAQHVGGAEDDVGEGGAADVSRPAVADPVVGGEGGARDGRRCVLSVAEAQQGRAIGLGLDDERALVAGASEQVGERHPFEGALGLSAADRDRRQRCARIGHERIHGPARRSEHLQRPGTRVADAPCRIADADGIAAAASTDRGEVGDDHVDALEDGLEFVADLPAGQFGAEPGGQRDFEQHVARPRHGTGERADAECRTESRRNLHRVGVAGGRRAFEMGERHRAERIIDHAGSVVGQHDVAPCLRRLDAVHGEAQRGGQRVIGMPADLGDVGDAVREERSGRVGRQLHIDEPHRPAPARVGVGVAIPRRLGLSDDQHIARSQPRVCPAEGGGGGAGGQRRVEPAPRPEAEDVQITVQHRVFDRLEHDRARRERQLLVARAGRDPRRQVRHPGEHSGRRRQQERRGGLVEGDLHPRARVAAVVHPVVDEASVRVAATTRLRAVCR